MPDILNSLRIYLKTKTAITSLVGSGDASRIYFHDAKEGAAMPFIILEIFEGESNEHLAGISGVCSNRIQIDCYGVTSAAAYNLAEAVRLAPLQMFRGSIATGGDLVRVLNVTSNVSYRRGFDPPVSGSSQKRYWVSRDYIIMYQGATS